MSHTLTAALLAGGVALAAQSMQSATFSALMFLAAGIIAAYAVVRWRDGKEQ